MRPGRVTKWLGSRLRGNVSRGAALVALAFAVGLAAPLASAAINDSDMAPRPKFIKPVTKKPAAGTRVNVVAQKLTYDSNTKIATATGLVEITYGPYTLTATKVVYDTQHDIFTANGSIVLNEPNGNVLEADTAEITDKFKAGFANHVKALLTDDVTITAEYAKRTVDNITVYEHATYTACKECVEPGGTPAWQVRAEKATHNETEKTIYYDNATFEIAGIPVAWFPHLAYPDPTVRRRSGFLIPRVGYGSNYGFDVVTPYFWAVTPSSDLTFSPMWTTKQGPVADLEWRQRLANGIYNIHGYGVYQLDPGAATYDTRWRGGVTSKGDFRLNDVWSAGWDGTLVSDKKFLDDYDFNNNHMATDQVYATALSDRSWFQAQALHYQTLLTDQNQGDFPTVLPYLQASHTFANPVAGGELGFDVNAYSLSRGDVVNNANANIELGTDQTRAVADLHWQKQMINGFGQVVTPFMAVRSDVYVSQNVPMADGTTTSQTTAHLLPSAGIDMRWPFLGALGSNQSIVTPVVQLISSANGHNDSAISNEDSVSLNFDTSNLFLESRTTGLDSYESGTRVNAGVQYSLLTPGGGFVRTSFGESYHIAGQNTFLPGSGLDGSASNLVGAVAWQPNETLRFTYQARVENDLSRINVQETSASLTLDRISGSLNFADIGAAPEYGRPDHEEQVWGDATWKLKDGWSVFGGLRYDLLGQNFIDKQVGVIFDCDCMTAKLAYSDGLSSSETKYTTDRRIELSVEFRTIGQVTGAFGF